MNCSKARVPASALEKLFPAFIPSVSSAPVTEWVEEKKCEEISGIWDTSGPLLASSNKCALFPVLIFAQEGADLFTILQTFPCCFCPPWPLQRLGSGNAPGVLCCSACWIVPAHLFPGLPALHCSPTCCLSLSCCLCGQAHNGSLGYGF